MNGFQIDPHLIERVEGGEAVSALLEARKQAATVEKQIARVERQVKVMESAALLNAAGSSEGMRKAQAIVDLGDDEQYTAAVSQLEQLRLELAGYEANAEAIRMLVRLIGFQVASDSSD